MTTRAIQIESLLTPVIDDNTGSICGAGYNVYFYAAGTSTPKNIWTEKEKTNPFTSRAMGADGTVQVYGDGIYKITIKDADADTIHEWDDVKIQANTYVVQFKSAAYTVTPEDDLIYVDTDGGAVEIDLEAVATFEHPVTVKNTGANSVTMDPNGAETIDGNSTVIILPNKALTLYPDTNSSIWRTTDDLTVATVSAAANYDATGLSAGALYTFRYRLTISTPAVLLVSCNGDVGANYCEAWHAVGEVAGGAVDNNNNGGGRSGNFRLFTQVATYYEGFLTFSSAPGDNTIALFNYQNAGYTDASNFYHASGGGFYDGAAPVTQVTIAPGSGTFSGTVVVERVG